MNDFAIDVLKGLLAPQKFLLSKYFYDDKGSRLFQQIMELKEYYLTRCEEEILENNAEAIHEILVHGCSNIHLIELGAGDGVKTQIIINKLINTGFPFEYTAVDISQKALDELAVTLKTIQPLTPHFIEAEYFEGLQAAADQTQDRNIILFLGSTIGNFDVNETDLFIKQLRSKIHPGDLVMLGFDLKKDPKIILAAYNDSEGITKKFNLNLLERINAELGGNFNLDKFDHCPIYNEALGEARSYLVSKCDQKVFIESLDNSFHFSKDELIHTEISRKYDIGYIHQLAASNKFTIASDFFDRKKYYCNSVWRACE